MGPRGSLKECNKNRNLICFKTCKTLHTVKLCTILGLDILFGLLPVQVPHVVVAAVVLQDHLNVGGVDGLVSQLVGVEIAVLTHLKMLMVKIHGFKSSFPAELKIVVFK